MGFGRHSLCILKVCCVSPVSQTSALTFAFLAMVFNVTCWSFHPGSRKRMKKSLRWTYTVTNSFKLSRFSTSYKQTFTSAEKNKNTTTNQKDPNQNKKPTTKNLLPLCSNTRLRHIILYLRRRGTEGEIGSASRCWGWEFQANFTAFREKQRLLFVTELLGVNRFWLFKIPN